MSAAPPRLIEALQDRYRIERELGQGGMATVYLAEDLKHHRKVAVKVLHPQLAAALGGERFLAEIRTTANLQHPNIVPLFDSGEADGLLYYVMPYITGESLREKLEREGRLDVATTVAIARSVAHALATAHDAGVVHRDIKPENILLVRGQPIVADFGIARAVDQAGGDRLTVTGMAMGTPAYMSPEQALGESTIDARSDLYSLGCVIYEMLAGRAPFSGGTVQALIAQRLVGPPPVLTGVPAAVSEVVRRSLATAPQDRFATALALADALLEAANRREAVEPVIVVLPFVNRSPDADNEYFSDGLTEEIITDLSKIGALRVISRNSTMALKGTTRDTPSIARELGVTHLVTGSVRRAGSALRVTAELVDAHSDAPLWGEKFAGTTDDVFAIQEEIARQIVAALQMTLTAQEERQVAERPIANPVAYDCYLRARQEMYVWTPDDTARAERLVDEAIEMVGEVPLLLATKAQLYWNRVNLNLAPPDEMLAKATEYAQRALALEPDLPLAIFVRGLVAGNRGKPEEALPDLYRAYELWPGDVNVLIELVRFSTTTGLRRHRHLAERTLLLDPLHFLPSLCMTVLHWSNGAFAECVPHARRAVTLSSRRSMVPLLVSTHLASAGLRDEGAGLLEELATNMRETPLGRIAVHQLAGLRGDRAGVVAAATPAFEAMLGNEFLAIHAAEAFAMVGLVDEGARFARLAVTKGFTNYPFLASHGAYFGEVRGHDDFKRLLDEVRPRWEAMVDWERRRAA